MTTKLYINTMDALFDIFAVDRDLPDPETYKGHTYYRPLPPRLTTFGGKSWSADDHLRADYLTSECEVFQRQRLVEPRSGKSFWYWHKVGAK